MYISIAKAVDPLTIKQYGYRNHRLFLTKFVCMLTCSAVFFSARRKYKQEMSVTDMECKISDIGYTFGVDNNVDLTSLFYIALDRGFLSHVTEDDQLKL